MGEMERYRFQMPDIHSSHYDGQNTSFYLHWHMDCTSWNSKSHQFYRRKDAGERMNVGIEMFLSYLWQKRRTVIVVTVLYRSYSVFCVFV
jgi:hypothetical protein